MSESSAVNKAQASLDSFFKPVQPASRSMTPSGSKRAPKATVKEPPTNFPHSAFSRSKLNSREGASVNSTVREPSTTSSQPTTYTSSVSPPPPSTADIYDIPISSPKPEIASSAPGRVVKSSDDEGDDSESSLEDLTTILQTNRSVNGSRPSPNGAAPSTPNSSRVKAFHTSPMPLLSKHKFDLKSLASHAEIDRNTEASSKRVKAMQEASQKKGNVPPRGENASSKLKHSDLLHSVVADQDGSDVHKVARAVMRTEATLSDQRWYFFGTQANPPKPARTPFPTKSISEEWKNDLKEPQMRHQTFVSGFAEDIVTFGKALPDEIFLWMLDEICVESSETLRASYCNILKASDGQIQRLVIPALIQTMFGRVGANSASTIVADKITTVPALTEPYAKRDWATLRSLIRFFGQVARSLQSRSYVVSLLLRMCVDRVVLENVDIFDLVQETIYRLCRRVHDDDWEANVSPFHPLFYNQD